MVINIFQYFMLPFELEFCKSINSKSDSIKIPSYLELKELLNLASENMADGNMHEEVTKEGESWFSEMLYPVLWLFSQA